MSLSKPLMSEWLSSIGTSSPAATLAAGTAVASSVLALWYWRYQAAAGSMPHLPTVPILGSLPYLPFDELPNYLIEQGSKLGSDVFDFYIGSRRVVVLNSFDVIQEALVQKSTEYASRPRYWSSKIFNPKQLGIIDMTFNQQLKENRHISLTILKDFGFGRFHMMESRIAREVEELVDLFAAKGGEAFDPRHYITLSVSNVINSILFDSRYEASDPEFKSLLQSIDRVVQLVTDAGNVDFFPLLRFLPSTTRVLTETKTEFDKIRGFLDNHVNRHIKGKTYESGQNDFTDAFITHYKSEGSLEGVDMENLYAILMDFFIAGTETTSTTLRWSLVYMANRPDVQERCHDELVREFGSNRPSYDERDKVPYCRAVLHEIQRLSCLVPLSVPHETSTDTDVAGFPVPKGTLIFPNLWASHMDETEFAEARTFNPDRFMDKDGNFVKSRRVIPFSLGRRSCIGEILARQEIFLLFTSLMQQFRILPPTDDGAELSEKGVLGIVNSPPEFTIRAVKREK